MFRRNRVNKDLSDDLIAARKSHRLTDIEQVENGINNAIRAAGGTVPIIKMNPGFLAKRQVLSYFKHANKIWESDKLTEERIFEVEEKAHRQTLIYRTLGTACAGLVIMLIYWIAQKAGIQMPF